MVSSNEENVRKVSEMRSNVESEDHSLLRFIYNHVPRQSATISSNGPGHQGHVLSNRPNQRILGWGTIFIFRLITSYHQEHVCLPYVWAHNCKKKTDHDVTVRVSLLLRRVLSNFDLPSRRVSPCHASLLSLVTNPPVLLSWRVSF